MSHPLVHRLLLAFLAPALGGSAAFAQSVTWSQEELERVAAEIRADIEELREAEFEAPVAVKLASKSEFLAHAKERIAKNQPPEQAAAEETMAKMLGLIPHDMDLMATGLKLIEEQVGGFYSPEKKCFYLMEGSPPGIARTILAHELGHALDDQLYGIDRGLEACKGNSDAQFAFSAVVEGSGTALMNRWTIENMATLDLAGMGKMQADSSRSMAAAPMLLWKPLLGIYLAGSAFLARTGSVVQAAARELSNPDIERAFRQPPRSTEQILHPDKYWQDDARDEPRTIEHDTARLPAGWQVLQRNTFGELQLAILTTPTAGRAAPDMSNPMAAVTMEFTRASAAGWGGDAVILLGNGSARVLELVTLWDSERDAGEFHGALDMLMPELEAAVAQLAAASGGESFVALDYGAGRDEVVLALGFGAKKSELRKVLDKLVHHERPATPK